MSFSSWVNLITSDKYYTVHPIYSFGDCFFECMVRALRTIPNAKIDVQTIRCYLSNALTEDIFLIYTNLFKMGDPEYLFMQYCRSLEDLKKLVKNTSIVWANETLISLFEKLFEIKVVIFSYDDFINRKSSYLRSCEIIDDVFKPKYYIIVHFANNHYDLISYNNQFLFTIHTLPDFLKLELYKRIPLFQMKVDGWSNLLNLLN